MGFDPSGRAFHLLKKTLSPSPDTFGFRRADFFIKTRANISRETSEKGISCDPQSSIDAD
jgi:hypothetical protein